MNNKFFEVAVAGGGVAGCAAALQAARNGRKTVLLEKSVFLGGLATAGLIYVYLPLCDGNGRQVTFGMAEELMRNSISLGPGDIPQNWNDVDDPMHPRFRCIFSPASFMLTLEELLVKAGVEIWYDTLVRDCVVTDNTLKAVIVENESGSLRIDADCFVDASGSAILARRANVPCTAGQNFISVWAMEYSKGLQGGLTENIKPFTFTTYGFDQECKIHMKEEDRQQLYPGLDEEQLRQQVITSGCDGRSVSNYVLETHRILRWHYRQKNNRLETFPLTLSAMPQFRTIYSINGEYVLDSEDYGKTFDDSIGLIADWRKPGYVWEIPYRALVPQGQFGGLLSAGRCISSIHDAWEVTRVIPPAVMTGQVAGLAAALASARHCQPWQIPYSDLHDALAKMGFQFHFADLPSCSDK